MDLKIKMLLSALKNISFYVLGAGASARLVPTVKDLRELMYENVKYASSYSTDSIIHSDKIKKIIGNPNKNTLISRVPSVYLEGLSIHEIAKYNFTFQSDYWEYEIFNTAKKPSLILTTNHDRLASRFCKNHFVLAIHGEIPEYFGSPFFLRIVQDTFTILDALPFTIDNLLFLEKENPSILKNRQYQFANKYYRYCNYLVIIGYSFGNYNNMLNDFVTYNFLFKNIYKFNKIPILLITPDSYELAQKIMDTIKSNQVYTLDLRWDYLSKAILSCKEGKYLIERIKDKYASF